MLTLFVLFTALSSNAFPISEWISALNAAAHRNGDKSPPSSISLLFSLLRLTMSLLSEEASDHQSDLGSVIFLLSRLFDLVFRDGNDHEALMQTQLMKDCFQLLNEKGVQCSVNVFVSGYR